MTRDTLDATLQDQLGVTFATVDVHERMRMLSGQPALDLSGSIAGQTGDTAFFFGMVGVDNDTDGSHPSPGPRLLPDCNGSDFTISNDGPPLNDWLGTCTSRSLDNGAIVIWRSGPRARRIRPLRRHARPAGRFRAVQRARPTRPSSTPSPASRTPRASTARSRQSCRPTPA